MGYVVFNEVIEEMKAALVREIVVRNENNNISSISKEDYQTIADFITSVFYKGGPLTATRDVIYAKKIMRLYAEELKQYDIDTLYVLSEI